VGAGGLAEGDEGGAVGLEGISQDDAIDWAMMVGWSGMAGGAKVDDEDL